MTADLTPAELAAERERLAQDLNAERGWRQRLDHAYMRAINAARLCAESFDATTQAAQRSQAMRWCAAAESCEEDERARREIARAEAAEARVAELGATLKRINLAFRHVPQQIADLGDDDGISDDPNEVLTRAIQCAGNAVSNFDYDEARAALAPRPPNPQEIPESSS